MTKFTYHASRFFPEPPEVRDPYTKITVEAETGGEAEALARSQLPQDEEWYLMLVDIERPDGTHPTRPGDRVVR